MNDEIIKFYEWDLDFFIKAAAQDIIRKDKAVNICEEIIYRGSSIALELAAMQMLYRLIIIEHPEGSIPIYESRKKYVTYRINQCIKELTNDKDKP